ncbi:MAG: hypothetical protein ACP5GH_06655 [Nitrososphaeria archaeon]
MRRRAEASTFVAILTMILAYGALLALVLLMRQPFAEPSPPAPAITVRYNISSQVLNITNAGACPLRIVGLAIFNGGSAYVIPYSAVLQPGQGTSIYLYSALTEGETVAVLTGCGAKEVVIS